MGTLKQFVIYIMKFFIPFTCVTLCQLYSITSSVLWKVSNYGMRKIENFCIHCCFSETHYIKGGRKSNTIALNTIAFLDTHDCEELILTKQLNFNIFVFTILVESSKSLSVINIIYHRYTDKLFDEFFLFFIAILSELHEKPKRKDWFTEKST